VIASYGGIVTAACSIVVHNSIISGVARQTIVTRRDQAWYQSVIGDDDRDEQPR